ncbi:MAG: transposase, partial [Calditrichaeota bacterium]|nr:transposase [Calditrichota bacterium]
IIRFFKAKSTRMIRLSGFKNFSWQRNYYEHIIRNENDLNRIRKYIIENPSQWNQDKKNPNNMDND